MRYFMKFSYDGSKYNGYQKQPEGNTIQEELEKALNKINSNKSVSVVASGRTDKGVHAYNQCAHFDLECNILPSKLAHSLNSLIPDNIYVKSIKHVNSDFHARYDVKKKEYIYKINVGKYNPLEKDYVFQYNRKLDIKEMRKALKLFEGTHDFRSFVKIDEEKENYERTILKTSLTKSKDLIIISITGTGFMRYMVRNIVGMLINIGEMKYRSDDVLYVLNKKDRKESGECAPACGLYLNKVYY